MASSLRISGLVVALLLGVVSPGSEAQARLRGTISAFDGKTVTVDGKEQVVLGENTEIVYAQPIAPADLKPGDFLGITSAKPTRARRASEPDDGREPHRLEDSGQSTEAVRRFN